MLELHLNLIIPIFIIIILLFICYNLYKKIVIYESWVIRIRNKITMLKSSVEEIDNRGLFEKDDDVGTIYEEISDLVKNFDDEIEIKK